MKTNSRTYLVIIGALVLFISALAWISFERQNKINEQVGLLSSLNDTIAVWKDKDGLNHAKIEVITTQSVKDFLAIKNLTGENKKLQESVEKYKKQIKNGGSVTNITTETKVKTKTPTVVTTEPKTDKDGVVTQRPVYTSKFDLDGWVVGTTRATADSTEIDLKVRNEYTVVIGEDKTGFLGLGKAKPFVEVTNLNKYSETTSLKTYNVDVKNKKKVWIYTGVAGIVVGTVGTILLLK